MLPTDSLCTCGVREVKINTDKNIIIHPKKNPTSLQPYLLLYLDLLIVLTGSGLRSSRQTGEFIGVTAIRVRTGHRRDKRIELVKISLNRENMTTLCAHVITLVLQHLRGAEKTLMHTCNTVTCNSFYLGSLF